MYYKTISGVRETYFFRRKEVEPVCGNKMEVQKIDFSCTALGLSPEPHKW